MNFPVPCRVISAILGEHGPLAEVEANWPLLEAALDAEAIYSPLAAVAAIATISVEAGTFRATKERGGPAYLTDLYEGRVDLGNVHAGDGAKFRGRGFIWIIGRSQYEYFGRKIGEDLIANPDVALDPAIAARIFAAKFKERQIREYADQQNWEIVRRRVNATVDEFPRFIWVVRKLVSALAIAAPAPAETSG